jgi:putative membrane protein
MPGMAPAGASLWSWLPVVPLVLMVAAYLVGVRRLVRRGDRWPLARSVSATAGLVALGAALLPPVSTHADVFAVHVVGHLLLAMLAPLLLALSAPITLLLRTAAVPARRRILAVVHSRAARVLTWAPVVLVLEVGGMYAFYLTPLFGLAHESGWIYLLVHVHMVLAGWLFSAVVAGRDPLPRRPGLTGALGLLLIAGAAHGILAKLMYAHDLPATAGTPAQVQLGAQVMFSGGDLVELATAAAVMTAWYARTGRAQRREAVRPRSAPAHRAAGGRVPELVLEAREQRGQQVVEGVELLGVEGARDEAVLDPDALVGRGPPASSARRGEADRPAAPVGVGARAGLDEACAREAVDPQAHRPRREPEGAGDVAR